MLFASFRKRRALHSYRGPLAARLRGTYGTRRYYRPEEVEYVARSNRFSFDYLCYAFAMYCDAEAFGLYHAQRGETCDYDRMRQEIGERMFEGDTSFSGATLTDPTHSHGCDSFDARAHGDAAHGGCDGGFDGGGFDGGGGGFDGGSCD